jgi:hypothetical protein
MDDLRESVAAVIEPALPVFPPQRIGFKVGDLLLLNRNQNPALDRIHDGWFTALNQNISQFLPEFIPPQSPPADARQFCCGSTKVSSLNVGMMAKASNLFRWEADMPVTVMRSFRYLSDPTPLLKPSWH